jgi:hypothetical protein
MQLERQCAEGCNGRRKPWHGSATALTAAHGAQDSQSAARKPPARPDAHWNSSGAGSTRWMFWAGVRGLWLR